jgi:methyl-accepting chemotaxis protein
MNNFRLWGYNRDQMYGADAAQAQRKVNGALVEKFNQLKKNVQESSQQLATELHNEYIDIETDLNNLSEQSERTSATQAHHLHAFEEMQQNLLEIAERAQRASSEILKVQQDIETGTVQHEQAQRAAKQEQDSAWVHAEQAHENMLALLAKIMKNLNLSIKNFKNTRK